MIKIMRIDEFASYGVNEMAVKGSALAQYDEVDRFNDEYLKVMKNGKYNLIDFDGNELSSIWFDDIEERKDHTFDVKFRDEANNVHTGNFDTNETPVTKTTFKASLNIPELNPIFNEIGINDIVVLLDPYTISNNVTDEKVKIVAIVTFKGQQYQLGEDGNLYDYDNNICFKKEENIDLTQKNSIDRFTVPDKDKVKLTNKLNDAFSYNSQMFPMFARFYNFGDGEKLYILFGTSLWNGKYEEDWTLTDDDIDILNKHCGCDVTDSEHINYDELDENGVKLENLEYYADEYIDDRPAISDAIAGIKMSEMDVKYRTESNCNYKSDDRTGGLDFLDKIVEYNDLYDYKHGYFMKCFEDIDEVLANSGWFTRSIVDTLKQIRSSDLLVRSIADLSNNKY